jgi:hypothetical protein
LPAPGEAEGPAPGEAEGCDVSVTTEALADEFQRLRGVPGHFQGGEWNAEVDAWMGRKHQVMIELGSQLGSGDCSQAQLIELLGPPDAIARPGDPLFDLVSRQPEFQKPSGGSYELLIYHWRGGHDVLCFAAQDQAIVGSGWWYAYE